MAGADTTKRVNRRIVYAKIESTPGTAEALAIENAIIAREIDLTPLEASTVERTLIRDFYGSDVALLSDRQVSATITCEMRGNTGTRVSPDYDPLLRACAFDGYLFDSSNAVKLEMTGTGANTIYTIDPDEEDTDTRIAYRPTSGVRVATGTARPATLPAQPSAGLCSCTIEVYYDGKRHRIVGAMGTLDINMVAGDIPTMTFTMQGNYVVPADADSYGGGNILPVPLIVNNENTALTLASTFNPKMYNFSFACGNNVSRQLLVGTPNETIITDRAATGSIEVQSTTIAQSNPFAQVGSGASQSIEIRHGPSTGRRIGLTVPNATIESISYGDNDGIETVVTPLRIIPSNTGNDEIQIDYYK